MMCFLLFFLFVCNVYSATASQTCAYGTDAKSEEEPAQMMRIWCAPIEANFYCPDTREEASDLITALQEEPAVRNGYYTGNALFHDCNELKRCTVVHLTESYEQSLCTAALKIVSTYNPAETCVCTTLQSTASLAGGAASAYNLHVHFAVKKGATVRNDFSCILEQNKDKKHFVFFENTSDSLLSAGEFLVQVQKLFQSLPKKTTHMRRITVCIGAFFPHADYTVGGIFYGEGVERVGDKDHILSRLAERATQAERIAAGKPCDQHFLESEEYYYQSHFWKFLVDHHVKATSVGAFFFETVDASKTTGNIFARNYPEKDFHTTILPAGCALDVLIGAPKDMEDKDRACVWSCNLRVASLMQENGFDVTPIFSADNNIHAATVPQPVDSEPHGLTLVCAGPKKFKEKITSWAQGVSAGAHSQIHFVACDGIPFPTPEYTTVSGGDFTECKETTNAIINHGALKA